MQYAHQFRESYLLFIKNQLFDGVKGIDRVGKTADMRGGEIVNGASLQIGKSFFDLPFKH
jgi:hypothetical protein